LEVANAAFVTAESAGRLGAASGGGCSRADGAGDGGIGFLLSGERGLGLKNKGRDRRNGKAPLGRGFFFLTLYFQNTKFSLKTCQICFGFLAQKSFGMWDSLLWVFGPGLTNFPHLGVLSGAVRRGSCAVPKRSEDSARKGTSAWCAGAIVLKFGQKKAELLAVG
jgi:hypothetical protein